MRVRLIGREKYDWSINDDRKNLEYFISKIRNLKISENFLFSDCYFFVWCDPLFKKKFLCFTKIIVLLKFIFNKKVVAVVTNDIRRYEEVFCKLKCLVDVWISPNKKISSFLSSYKVRYSEMPFYVGDKTFYHMHVSKKELAVELKIDYEIIKDRILIGSFQRDSLGKNLLKPKWQKDPDTFVKILENLDRRKFLVILAGPRRHYITRKIREKEIPYIYIGDESYIDKNIDDITTNNLSKERINLLYNLIDLYVVTSSSEGGPKSILESSLTKTLIISTDVGLAPDFIHKDLIFSKDKISEISSFINSMKSYSDNKYRAKIKEYVEFNFRTVGLAQKEKNYLLFYQKIFDSL